MLCWTLFNEHQKETLGDGMMNTLCKRWFVMAMVAISGFAMTVVAFDAEARRFGGGMSSGRQSTNVMQQRQAVTPPAAAPRPAAGTPAAGARWLGPVAGIAAAFGLGVLLAHFGMTGALADLFVLAMLALVAGLGIAFIVRALRSNMGPGSGSGYASAAAQAGMQRRQYGQDDPAPATRASGSGLFGAGPLAVAPAGPLVGDWFIPADFDQQTFLDEAKKQFIAVQKAWDSMDFDGLQGRLTDEMYAQYAGQMAAHGGRNQTDVVLLNADLMGIEKLKDGHLASVRFSGMIREDPRAEAASFEEVWNLYKPDGKGWLLAGIQQLPSH